MYSSYLPNGTLLHTENGLLSVEKINKFSNLLTFNHNSSNSFSLDTKKYKTNLLIIKTPTGIVKCSKLQKLAIINDTYDESKNENCNNTPYIWRSAEELRLSDKLVISVKKIVSEQKNKITDIDNAPELDKEIAFLLGYCHMNSQNAKIVNNRVSFNYNSFLSFLKPEKFKFKLELLENEFIIDSESFFKHMLAIKKTSRIPSYITESSVEIRTSYIEGVNAALYFTKQFNSSRFMHNVASLYSSIGVKTFIDTKNMLIRFEKKTGYLSSMWNLVKSITPFISSNNNLLYTTISEITEDDKKSSVFRLTADKPIEFIINNGFLATNL